MRVLKKGRKQNGWSKEFTCTGKGNGDGGCGAELLVSEGDLFLTYSSACGEIDTYTTFECVECTVHTDISRGVAPHINQSYKQWKEKHAK